MMGLWLLPRDSLGNGGFLVSSMVGVLADEEGRLCWTVRLRFKEVEPPPLGLSAGWCPPPLFLLCGKSAARLFIISREAMRSSSLEKAFVNGLEAFMGECIFSTCLLLDRPPPASGESP